MTNQVMHLSNNVFDLEFLSKKEFYEMVQNFVKTCKILGFYSDELDKEEILENELKNIGIVDSKHSFKLIKSYLDETLVHELLQVVSYLHKNDHVIDKYLDRFYLSKRRKRVEVEELSDKPTMVDLFCGAGGLSLGFTQNDFRVVFANDIEKSALRTYSFNHPEIHGSRITMGGIEDIAHHVHSYIEEEVDVLVGGPPCQGFSMANRQRIIDDPRNVLYKYYVESVRNLKPKIFVMENVKGMKSVANQVVEDFNSSIDVKYDIDFNIFNAKDFGVPQNRERLIYIGIRSDIAEKNEVSASVLLDNILSLAFSEPNVLSEALVNLKELKASRIKNSTELDTEESGKKIDVATNLMQTKYLELINLGETYELVYNHKARYNNDRDIEIYSRMLPGDKSDSERIADIMPYKSRSHMFKDKYFKLIPNQPCKTITAHMKFDCNMYIHPTEARGLTPREAARIQSYPDNYLFLGSFTKTYMQIGNSVPPLLSRVISKVVKQYI